MRPKAKGEKWPGLPDRLREAFEQAGYWNKDGDKPDVLRFSLEKGVTDMARKQRKNKFPTIGKLDDMTRTDETPLSDGGSWSSFRGSLNSMMCMGCGQEWHGLREENPMLTHVCPGARDSADRAATASPPATSADTTGK